MAVPHEMYGKEFATDLTLLIESGVPGYEIFQKNHNLQKMGQILAICCGGQPVP